MTSDIETLQQSLETALMERDVARRQLEQIAEYGCLWEEDPFCSDVEDTVDEYCHPCQAQHAINAMSNLESYRQHQAVRDAVIQAAKEWRSIFVIPFTPLVKAVDALEKMEGDK